MNIENAIILGAVQGLTEFLPVSSSGHLVVFQKTLTGFSQPGVLFDVLLHFGTLLSVLVYFRKRLFELIKTNFWFIGIATIPAALAGFFLDDFFEGLFGDTLYVGFEFLVNAAMSYFVAISAGRNVKLGLKNSFLMGISQAIAISPGISRSGATIFTGSVLGIEKEKAAEFSFILSLPAIFGANLLQIIKYGGNYTFDYSGYFLGALSAFVFGLIAIRLVMDFIKKGKFKIFAAYSFVAGLIIIFLSL